MRSYEKSGILRKKLILFWKGSFCAYVHLGKKPPLPKIASKFKLFIETFQMILRRSSCHKSGTGYELMKNYKKKSKNE